MARHPLCRDHFDAIASFDNTPNDVKDHARVTVNQYRLKQNIGQTG